MKVLIINGSPKVSKSNTLKLTKAFVKGLSLECDIQTEELAVCKMHIEPCCGCLNCWKKTPGRCFHKDDMADALEKLIAADIIIWSFPLYYYSLPGQLKIFLDRQVPTRQPKMQDRADGKGNGLHSCRYDESRQRHVLISTCGFYSYKGNYNSILEQFDLMLGVGNYTTLFYGQGEMLPVPFFAERVEEYLGHVEKAGAEYGRIGTITPQLRKKLDEHLIPKDKFENMADDYYKHCEEKAKEADKEKE